MNSFWNNTIWYIALGCLTILELIFVFIKSKDKKFVLAFYLTVTGITLIIEVTLIFVFRAYHYYPKLIPHKPFIDELAGNFFSQLSVAATAVLIAVFNLKFYWYLIFAALYGLIEELFLALGIYSHIWYRTWITVWGLIFLFWIIKKDYKKSQQSFKSPLYYINIYFSLITLDTITIIWAFMLSGYQAYTRHFGNIPLTSPYLVANIYASTIYISLMAAYFFRLKPSYKAMVILALCGYTFILNKLNIIYFKNEWWFLFFFTSVIIWAYCSIVFMDYLYKSKTNQL